MGTMDEIKRLLDAYEAGCACGAKMTSGALFLGAAPEADLAGFTARGERSVFITGFLRTLPRPVRIDVVGRIV